MKEGEGMGIVLSGSEWLNISGGGGGRERERESGSEMGVTNNINNLYIIGSSFIRVNTSLSIGVQ